MRISDWSSDVCSSDLGPDPRGRHPRRAHSAHAPGRGRVRREEAEPRGRLPRPRGNGGLTVSTFFLSDTAALLGRSLRHILRSPDTIITTAITPIVMLVMFVYVFGGEIGRASCRERVCQIV